MGISPAVRHVSGDGVARVVDGAGQVVGAGFLLAPDIVATCAHVVADAAGTDPTGDFPEVDVIVEFPLAGGDAGRLGAVSARVHRWVPIGPDGRGDIALLRLRRRAPSGTRMPPLRRVDGLWGRRFRVLGFPAHMADGVWATGEFRGVQGTRWAQLQGALGDQPIEPGFSGAPVWDEDSGAVVGMTVAVDRDATTTTAYLIPIDQVLGMDPQILPNPYRGLEPFDEEHSTFFFGRDEVIDHLHAAVVSRPLVAVVGRSGAGKSSLIRAGLVPRLRQTGSTIVEQRAEVPIEPLVTALVTGLCPGLDETAIRAIVGELSDDEARHDGALARLTGEAGEAGVVLVADQFEELVGVDPDGARRLLEVLMSVVTALPSGALRVVMTLRLESLDELLTPELASTLQAGTVFLPPMSRGELRAAILGPAEWAPGLDFEDGLVERILDDTGIEPGRLPLLESLLAQLWERRTGGALTVAGYEQAGGVAGSVTRLADELVAQYPNADLRTLRELLCRLARPDRDGRFVRRPLTWSELTPAMHRVLPGLATARLVVIGRDADGERSCELAHQALIDHWPRLRRWLVEDRDFLTWRSGVGEQQQRWADGGRDDGALLRGTALTAAQEWLRDRLREVPASAQEYVRRSHLRQRAEVRRWRALAGVLTVAVLLAGTFAAVSFERGSRLAGQLATANAEALGRGASARAVDDPVTATQLALAAWRADPVSPAARTALLDQYLGMRQVDAVYPDLTDGPISSFVMSRDGDTLGYTTDDDAGVATGIIGSTPARWQLPGLPAGYALALSPDGRTTAAAGPDGAVLLWDVKARSGPEVLRPAGSDPADGPLPDIVFSLDGRRLAVLVAGATDRFAHFDVDRRVLLPLAVDPTDGVDDIDRVWLTDDPEQVLLRPRDKFDANYGPLLRSLVDGSTLRTVPAGSLIAGNGAAIVSCEDQPEFDAYDIAIVTQTSTGAMRSRFPLAGPNSCSEVGGPSVVASADGGFLLEAVGGSSADIGLLRVTDITDGRSFYAEVPPLPVAWSAAPPGVLRTPGGDLQVVTVRGGSVMRTGALHPDVLAEVRPVDLATTWAADGSHAVVREFEGVYVALDGRTGRVLGRLPYAAAAAPDGSTPVSSDVDSVVSLIFRTGDHWEMTQYSVPRFELVGRYTFPGSIGAFSYVEEADRLVAVSKGIVSVWDTRTHQLLHKPIRLGEGDAAGDKYEQAAFARIRPGHPEQFGILVPGRGVEIWDATEARRLATLPVPIDQGRGALFSFDRNGSRVVVLTGNRLEVWDIDSRRPLRPPIIVPSNSSMLGFTDDGYLVTGNGGGAVPIHELQFWDLELGTVSGSPSFGLLPTEEILDGQTLRVDAPLPIRVPVVAQQWFDTLCQVVDRPFTPAELQLLPAGADTTPPCRT